MSSKNAAIIIIGNEILSGKTTDVNTPFLTRELRTLGVSVQRVSVIPDDVHVIGETVRDYLKRYDWIFSCGGIGPTHDDVTMAGIALGVDKPLIQHAVLLNHLRKNYGTTPNDAQLKMTEVPEGTELIFDECLHVPVLYFRQLYIFPGIPELVVRKFNAIKEIFREAPFHLVKLYITLGESAIAAQLHEILVQYPLLQLGSYPKLNKPDHKIVLTLESKENAYLSQALHSLLDLLPTGAVLRIDPALDTFQLNVDTT